MNEILHGDCIALLPEILKRYPKNQIAIITDPPYGGDYDTDYTRFSTGGKSKNIKHKPIEGDKEPFDPSPWLDFPKVTLWGYPHFAQKLPLGTTLVWIKKSGDSLGTFLSDAEIAWQKGGRGVYVFNHLWNGVCRGSEIGYHVHPTQKPVKLFEWCIRRQNLPNGTIILDPYAGSGPCLEAAHNLGFDWIGIDIEPDYVEVSKNRMTKVLRQPRLLI